MFRERTRKRDGNSDNDDSLKKKKKFERSTTPDGDSPRGSIDFATMHRTSGHIEKTKDFATLYGFKKEEEKLKKEGLEGKYRVLEPPDDSYGCHDLTYFDGRPSTMEARRSIRDHFQTLGSKNDFQNNPSLYDELISKLSKNKDSCVVEYHVPGDVPHSSPIARVYLKENGERSIELWGKWGQGGPLVIHDIENVPRAYQDQGQVNWEIRFTNREHGRIMDR